MIEPPMTFKHPSTYTPENVIYWEITSKELRMQGRYGISILNKARKFLQEGCIEQITPTTWICKPIKKYNKTEYLISLTEDGFFCKCQGFRKKKDDFDKGNSDIKPICSHILGVKQFSYIKEKNFQEKRIS